MNDTELYMKLIDVLSDDSCKKRQNEKKFQNLCAELAQLPTDSSVRIALIDLCEALADLSYELDYYKQWI